MYKVRSSEIFVDIKENFNLHFCNFFNNITAGHFFHLQKIKYIFIMLWLKGRTLSTCVTFHILFAPFFFLQLLSVTYALKILKYKTKENNLKFKKTRT